MLDESIRWDDSVDKAKVLDQFPVAPLVRASRPNTLTSDTVPVNVDAVLFGMVHDVQKAALEVQDYAHAVSWAAQPALRDILVRTTLIDLVRGREWISG